MRMRKCLQGRSVGIQENTAAVEQKGVQRVPAVDGSNAQVCHAAVQLCYMHQGSLHLSRRCPHPDSLNEQLCLCVIMTQHVRAQHVKQSRSDKEDVVGKVFQSMVPRCACVTCLEKSTRGLVAEQERHLGFAGGWKIVMYKCREDYMCDAMQMCNLKFPNTSKRRLHLPMQNRQIARWIAKVAKA